jgi:selenocysteine lyase/cysteine desulfurase
MIYLHRDYVNDSLRRMSSDLPCPFSMSRRQFVGGAGVTAALMAATPAEAAQEAFPAAPVGPPEQIARDEVFWQRVATQYRVSAAVTNLENGYWGVMPTAVLAAYTAHLERVNTDGVYYIRTTYPQELEAARARVAAALGAGVDEIAFTRGATEAMQVLIGGYNRLKPGDAVLYGDLDYQGMQYAMNWLQERRAVRVVKVSMPEPATTARILETYSAALDANPAVRLMLLMHCSHKTGLVFPVPELVALARARGVDVLVDAAQSWGQIPTDVTALGADFVGFTLQKWIAGPVGLGAVYIRKTRLGDIDRMMSDEDNPAGSILSRVHSGTANFAAMLTAPAALDAHDRIGPANKAARLRYLRDRWVNAVRHLPGVEILTPDEPGRAGGMTSFRLNGTSTAHNQQLIETLRDRYGLFTARRTGIARGDCVRVTPALYNSAADVDRLAAAITELARA